MGGGFGLIMLVLVVAVAMRSVLSKTRGDERQGPIRDDDLVETTRSSAGPKNVTVEPEILKKSKEEVNEDFGYDIIRQAADKHDNCIEGHYEESADFMKTVQDLMVMGPNCSMSYERDFISEGEKMLSGYVGDKKSA